MSKYSKFWPKGGLPGILHHYVSPVILMLPSSVSPWHRHRHSNA